MFTLCRNYLAGIATTLGIPFTYLPQALGGARMVEILSVPNSGKLDRPFERNEEIIRYYRDWYLPETLEPGEDPDPNFDHVRTTPIIRKRVRKGIFSINFTVAFVNITMDLTDEDYRNFICALAKYTHDGQVGYYIDRYNVNQTDSVGNPIAIKTGAFTVNDNKAYGDLPNKIIQEITFTGGIYVTPDADSGLVNVPASYVAPVGLINSSTED